MAALVTLLAGLGAAVTLAAPQHEFFASCSVPEPVSIAAGLLTYNTRDCLISPPADTDQFTFHGTRLQAIRLTIVSTSGVDPRAVLIAPDGATIADQSCPVGPCSVRIAVKLATTGTYELRVTDVGADETGSYVASFERVAPLNCPLVPAAVAHDDVLDPVSDGDLLRVEGQAGDTMRLTVESTGGVDPRVELFDPGRTVIRDESCTGPCTLTIDETLAASGTFFALVSDVQADESGAYRVALECLAGCSGDRVVDGFRFSDKQTAAWDATADPTAGFELVRGSLDALQATRKFTGSITDCVASDLVVPITVDPELPAPGQGFAYSARSTGGSRAPGSPDARYGPAQVCGRTTSLCRGRGCDNAIEIPPVGPSTVYRETNNTCGAPTVVTDYNNADTTGSCNTLLYPGPELIYRLTVLPAEGTPTISLVPNPASDMGVFLVDDCADPRSCLGFSDIVGFGSVATLVPRMLLAGTYYLYVDSYYGAAPEGCGPYTITVTGPWLAAAPTLVSFE